MFLNFLASTCGTSCIKIARHCVARGWVLCMSQWHFFEKCVERIITPFIQDTIIDNCYNFPEGEAIYQ